MRVRAFIRKLFRAENGNAYISSTRHAARAAEGAAAEVAAVAAAAALGAVVRGAGTREQREGVLERGLCAQTRVELLLRRPVPAGTRLEQDARHFRLGILDAGEQLLEGDLQNYDQRSRRLLGVLEEPRHPYGRRQAALCARAVAAGDAGHRQHAFHRRCPDPRRGDGVRGDGDNLAERRVRRGRAVVSRDDRRPRAGACENEPAGVPRSAEAGHLPLSSRS
jgi:hypothetical protein